MLVLHSSSRCDVCLSEYSWETSGKRPHAIACGHIFCRDCLYTNNPPLCPLCRKPYQPNKMKKLHVDKPEDIDDHKEIDLLQRLVISWDTPAEQLEEITTEVDLWLGLRSDEACIALRRARAALTKHRELKEAEELLLETIHRLEEEIERLDTTVVNERTRSMVTSEAYMAKIEVMTSEMIEVQSELASLQSLTHRYTYNRNPLPPPPEPISTDQIPTFEQAVSESGSGVRFAELPTSPRSRHPFEVESRRSRKGKTNSAERRHAYEDPRYHLSPRTQTVPYRQATPTSHYVQPHIAPQMPIYEQSSSQSTRSTGLQLHFESTNQPLDAFALTHAYLREYSSGFVNGQEVASGRRITEPTESYSSTRQSYASSSRHPQQPASAFEPPMESYRAPSANIYQNQPYSAPVASERSPRPTHRRQSTAESSIISSASSLAHDRPSSRSRPRSRPRESSTATQDQQFNNPLLASILSSNPARSPSSRHSNGLASPRAPRSHASVTFSQLDQPQRPNYPEPPSNSPSPVPPAASDHRSSPSASARSRRTLESGSWGTPTPSHLASGSLISGLAGFRSGAEPVFEGGQEITAFQPLGSDGESIRTRQTSFSDLSSEAAAPHSSPVRPIQSMVGVLPSEGDGLSVRSSRDERERMPGSYRSPTSIDTHSSRHSNSWEAGAYSSRNRNSFGSGYQPEDDFSQHRDNASSTNGSSNQRYGRPAREDRAASYRSPTSVDTRAHETWADPHSSGQVHPTNDFAWTYSNDGRPLGEPEHPPASSLGSGESTRHGRSRRLARPRTNLRSLPAESPFPVTVEYTDDDRYPAQQRGSPGLAAAPPPAAMHVEPPPPPAFSGNALGLELTTGPTPISAPTPVVSSRSFLRSWSREHYES